MATVCHITAENQTETHKDSQMGSRCKIRIKQIAHTGTAGQVRSNAYAGHRRVLKSVEVRHDGVQQIRRLRCMILCVEEEQEKL